MYTSSTSSVALLPDRKGPLKLCAGWFRHLCTALRLLPSVPSCPPVFCLLPSTFYFCLRLLQNPHRRVPPRRAHDAAAGMRGRAAHVEVLDRRLGTAPSRARGAGRTAARASARPGRCCLPISPNSRSMSSGVSTCRCRMMFLMFGAYSAIVSITVSPNASRWSSQVPSLQVVRRVLHEARHHVLARRRDRRIGEARDHHVDVRPPREAPVLRLVVGALHVVDARRDRDRAAQVRAGARAGR